MPDYFFGGVSAVCVQTRLKTPEIGLAGSVGPRRLVGRVRPVQYDKLSPPLCALGELCTLDRKCLGKTLKNKEKRGARGFRGFLLLFVWL